MKSVKRQNFPEPTKVDNKGTHEHVDGQHKKSSEFQSFKKKKTNKMLCEIVGPENKHTLELRLESATRFFDDDSEKK